MNGSYHPMLMLQVTNPIYKTSGFVLSADKDNEHSRGGFCIVFSGDLKSIFLEIIKSVLKRYLRSFSIENRPSHWSRIVGQLDLGLHVMGTF